MVKNPPANAGDAGDVGLIPWLGRSPAVGNGNPLHYSCLEKSMDRGNWQAMVQGSQRVRHDLATKQQMCVCVCVCVCVCTHAIHMVYGALQCMHVQEALQGAKSGRKELVTMKK